MPLRPSLKDGALGLLEFGRRHGLHRLGDLLGVLDAPDAASQIDEGGHSILLF
jgi:hypothetical protein